MNIITDKGELDKLIASIAKRASSLDKDIQIAGVSALDHHKRHGDVGFINRLYLALGKGHRKAALSSWLLTHGGVIANDGENKKEMPFKHTKDKTTNVEAAAADPWFNHKPDQQPDEVFDLAKALETVLKRAQGKQLVHGELLAPVQAALAMVNAAENQKAITAGEDEAPM